MTWKHARTYKRPVTRANSIRWKEPAVGIILAACGGQKGNRDMGEELPQLQPERHQIPGPGSQPLGAGVYAGFAFASLAATCLVGYGMYYAGTQLASEPVIRSFYYVLLWVLGITSALFLFGVLRSAASISGRQWGAMIDVGGPAALAVLVVAGGYTFAKLPDAFSLTVRLQGDSQIAEMTSGAKLWVDCRHGSHCCQ